MRHPEADRNGQQRPVRQLVRRRTDGFPEKIRSAGLMPSFGTVGDGRDNAMIESFRSSMQIELLNSKKWKTRVELANAIFDYIEIFHNRQQRHSALGYRTPIEHELASTQHPSPPNDSHLTG